MLKLGKALADWQPSEGAGRDPVVLLEAGWEEIVGGEVARNSRPARISAGALVVTTRSSAWSHQLTFLAEHVLRAVSARLPAAGIQRMQFRVGHIPHRPERGAVRPSRRGRAEQPARPPAKSTGEALARFRRDVEQQQQNRRSYGWNECRGCGALAVASTGVLCAACASSQAQERGSATARLLFEAPWLGYTGTAALVDGLQEEEYERVRTGLLKHWWGTLARARAAKRLSRDGRERSLASSYVLLQSKLAPEEIIPATVRSILGDELHDLLYGEASREGGAANDQKRRN